MKKLLMLFGLIVAIIAGTGCATKGKIGNGELEPLTKTAINLGATAASVAAPEYAGAIKTVKDKLTGAEATASAMLTDAEFFAWAKKMGFIVSLVYRVDGAIVAGETVSWTWNISRAHTGADSVPPSAEAVEEATADTGVDAQFDAAAAAYEAAQAAKKKAK